MAGRLLVCKDLKFNDQDIGWPLNVTAVVLEIMAPLLVCQFVEWYDIAACLPHGYVVLCRPRGQPQIMHQILTIGFKIKT